MRGGEVAPAVLPTILFPL